jgi:hypothetical protein
MSIIKAEINAFRQELQTILPMMIAEAVRQELDRRGIITGTVVTQEHELTGDGTGEALPPVEEPKPRPPHWRNQQGGA